eukprot:2089252-Amphidinium_carterae.1
MAARFATSFFWPSERVDENSFVPVRDAFTFNDPRNKGKTVHIIAFSQPGQDCALIGLPNEYRWCCLQQLSHLPLVQICQSLVPFIVAAVT